MTLARPVSTPKWRTHTAPTESIAAGSAEITLTAPAVHPAVLSHSTSTRLRVMSERPDPAPAPALADARHRQDDLLKKSGYVSARSDDSNPRREAAEILPASRTYAPEKSGAAFWIPIVDVQDIVDFHVMRGFERHRVGSELVPTPPFFFSRKERNDERAWWSLQ